MLNAPSLAPPPVAVPLPNVIDAEQSVLGSVLVSALAMGQVSQRLKPHHFSRPHHAEIYTACLELASQGDTPDVISVPEVLEARRTLESVGGRVYINDLAIAILSTENVEYHAEVVIDRAVRRSAHKLGVELTAMATDAESGLKCVEQAQARLSEIAMTDGNCKQVEAIDGLLGSAVDRMKERMATPDKLPGVSTGFCELDTLLCGLQKTDLIILAARPSMGKTALCLNIAGQVAIRERQPVLFFSLEMSKDQLAQRLLCTEAGIDAQRVRGGYMNEKDLAKAVKTKAALADVPLYIDDSPNPGLIEMQAKARQLMAKLGNQPLGLVVVDYMQLMSSPMGNKRDLGNRVNEVGAISRGMKGLAKGLDCPVLVLSQLSRAVEQRADKRPMLSDLRESGSIEQDADVVMFIYRDEYYNPEETDCPGMADIIVAKQRNGPVGTIPLVYRNSTTQFMNPVKSYNSSF